jgi:hypothetical protein
MYDNKDVVSYHTFMTTDSKLLLEFLQTNIAHKLSHIKLARFSSNATELLSSIFEKLKQAQTDYDNTTLVLDSMKENAVPHGANYKLCPPKVRKHIEGMTSTSQTCRFSIGHREIVVHLVYEHIEGSRRPVFKRVFGEIYGLIYLLIHLLSSYSRTECSRTLSIYLYLTSMKKTLVECDRDCTIGEDNANTAFTFACKRINEVYLYRKEEWFKVLAHELFHSLGLDFSEFDCESTNREIFKFIPIRTDLRLYEAYTEFWGELLNNIFISYFSDKQRTNVSKMVKKLETLVYHERMFSVYQSSKILTHFGMSYDDLYTDTDDAVRTRRFYKETTPILSYYILKNILMFYIDDFLEWCHAHNQHSLEFNKSPLEKNIENFIEFIRKHHNKEELVESMNQARTWFLKQENNRRADKTPIVTMRMSLLDHYVAL